MSDRPHLLVVGCGSIGERHLRCFQQTGGADLSLCESNDALREDVAARYGIPRTFASYDEALEHGPDAVVICTPAHLHTRMALAAAGRGCHLLVEKPLSTTLEGVDALQEAVDSRNLVAAVAYVYRAHPALSEMREVLRSGRFGRPVQAVVNAGQNFPFYRPAYRDIYYRDRATGGGAVQDALTHSFNAVEWLVGPATRLVADGGHALLEGVTVEDTVHVLARHGDVHASYSLNQYQAPNEITITIVCERGTLRFEYHRSRWRWQDDPAGTWQDQTVSGLERDTLFLNQASAFLDAISGKREPLCTLAEGIATLRANLAILESIENGQWIEVAV